MQEKDNLQIYAAPLPFSNRTENIIAFEGSTLRDIYNLTVKDKYNIDGIVAIMQINGEIIAPCFWKSIRPKKNAIVNIKLVPAGGAGQKVLKAVLLIVVAIAAYYGGLAVAATYGAAAGAAAAATISIVGSMLVQALVPPPMPTTKSVDNSNAAESQSQFIEGARNAISPFGVVPICLGTNRMFPYQAAKPFTETENNDQYVRQLFTYGYGPKLTISDLRIGESLLSDFNDFEIEHLLEGNLHNSTTIYPSTVQQESYSILLSNPDGSSPYTIRTTQDDVDEAIVDVVFPRGLSFYDSQGKRRAQRVILDASYSPAGLNQWSAHAQEYLSASGEEIQVDPAILTTTTEIVDDVEYYVGYRRDIIVIDSFSGIISLIKGTDIGTSDILNPTQSVGLTTPSATTSANAAPPDVPFQKIRLATVLVRTSAQVDSDLDTELTTIIDMSDDRNAGSTAFGPIFLLPTDFTPSYVDDVVTVTSGNLTQSQMDYTASQTEALQRSIRFVFPERGQYDIRIRRLTQDVINDQVFDQVFLTSIKSVTYSSPVNLPGINGTAIRIKATDQLNGSIDQFNCIVSLIIDDYNDGVGGWSPRITNNPASLYRYVLQGLPNSKPLEDSKIDIAALEDWHEYCTSQNYSYNRVIDYPASVDDILRDIAASGSASPAIVDGKRTIVIDRIKDQISQVITPRNSWDYNGQLNYPEMPHAFRVQFRNRDNAYQQDERIVYDDGYSEFGEVPGTVAATLFEVLELQSCTNAELAFKDGRRYLATARLRPEVHSWMMDMENLVAFRGDRIKIQHDIPLFGVGNGRVKSIIIDDSTSANVIGFTIDDTVLIANNGIYYTRIRRSDGVQIYKQVLTSIGENKSFLFASPLSEEDSFEVGDLCYFVAAGGEGDLVILKIEPQQDLSARVTALNYAPEIFEAENIPIPPWQGNVATPLSFIRPIAPILVNAQSDENVMLKNSDGTFTPRAIFTLQNVNPYDVLVSVKVRRTGSTNFTNANVLEATPERLILTGLDDGSRYDIHIRYRTVGGSVMSLPLELNSYLFVGGSGYPDDVTGFEINVTGANALLKWDANDDVDLAYYKIKFSSAFVGATWGTSQILEEKVYENRLTVAFQPGTYLIKAVDYLGNESINATIIITYNPDIIENAVQLLQESPDFLGVKDNVVLSASDHASILLADTTMDGYYYFDNSLDLTGVFTSFVSAAIIANGTFTNDLFEEDDIFAMDDIFGLTGGNDLFAIDDLFSTDDMFGIGSDGWMVELQFRTTQDDPTGSPTWSDWAVFTTGNLVFWGIEFRLLLRSLAENVTPQVTQLSVLIDMPDRVERGQGLTVPVGGINIVFSPEFQTTPAVVITIQNGNEGDEISNVSDGAGFYFFKVYNRNTSTYVSRTFNYIASGYGRKST